MNIHIKKLFSFQGYNMHQENWNTYTIKYLAYGHKQYKYQEIRATITFCVENRFEKEVDIHFKLDLGIMEEKTDMEILAFFLTTWKKQLNDDIEKGKKAILKLHKQYPEGKEIRKVIRIREKNIDFDKL